MSETVNAAIDLSRDLGISIGLAHDLYTLSGQDKNIVHECSESSDGLGSTKCGIVDMRFRKIEDRIANIEKGQSNGYRREQEDSEEAKETYHQDIS